ncbi:MAG TPA: RNA polymerase sigma factor [Novosphingobium sp.]|nr:RNA polymerase sigma factor [Novosphingobium sp.]
MISPPSTVAWIAAEILPHEAGLRASLRRAGVQPSEIDDIVQEAYCRLSEMGDTAHIRSPRAYFFVTARSILLQRLRRDRVVPIQSMADEAWFEAADDAPSIEQAVGARMTLGRVLKAIAALPQNYRAVVELRRLEGLSQKETASRLGVSEKIVENNLARGLKAVLKAMEGEDTDHRAQGDDDMEGRRLVARH